MSERGRRVSVAAEKLPKGRRLRRRTAHQGVANGLANLALNWFSYNLHRGRWPASTSATGKRTRTLIAKRLQPGKGSHAGSRNDSPDARRAFGERDGEQALFGG